MIYNFEFNGRKLSDLGAIITEAPHYVVAVREIDSVAIPGKSGDVIVDKQRFKNAPYTYKIAHVPTLSDLTDCEFTSALSAWLLTVHDYAPLRDSWNRGYFRKAVCESIGELKAEASGTATTAITFNCAPFWFSDAGAQSVTVNSHSGSATWNFHNPEAWRSEPIIRIDGSGDFTVTVGSQSLTIEDVDGTAIIDKPNENVIDGSGTDINDQLLLSSLSLPSLPVGDGTLTVTGSGSFTVTITPNWRRL